jgi:hypothetical protein
MGLMKVGDMLESMKRFQTHLAILLSVSALFGCAPIKDPIAVDPATGKPEKSANSGDSACKYNLVFLPQLGNHEVLRLNGQQDYSKNELATSQIQIVNFLRGEKSNPVFAEQIGQTISIEGDSRSNYLSTLRTYKGTFPNGIPQAITAFSDSQLELLLKNGGAYATLMIEERKSLQSVALTKQIYESQVQATEGALSNHLKDGQRRPVNPGSDLFKRFYFDRERSALTQIKNYVLANPRTTRVILVHNAKLNFAQHSDLIPAKCILIPTEFAATLSQ